MASGITVTFSLVPSNVTVCLVVFLTSPILSNTLASFWYSPFRRTYAIYCLICSFSYINRFIYSTNPFYGSSRSARNHR